MNIVSEEFRNTIKPLSSAAELVELGVYRSTRTANNYRNLGKGIPFIKLPGGSIRYTKEAVIAFIEQSLQPKKKPAAQEVK